MTDAVVSTEESVTEPSSEQGKSSGRGRFTISIILLVVALVATPLFVVAGWVNTEITNTDRYVHTVAPLADDPQVQQYVASELTAAFTENVDLSAAIGAQLPPALQPLTGTIDQCHQRLRLRRGQPLHGQPGLQDDLGGGQPSSPPGDLQGAHRRPEVAGPQQRAAHDQPGRRRPPAAGSAGGRRVRRGRARSTSAVSTARSCWPMVSRWRSSRRPATPSAC